MAKKTVLIADNSLINRLFLAGIMKDEYDVLEAVDGQAAIDLLKDGTTHVDAVLLDLIMPGKDGYQVLTELRADEATRQIPVLVVTAESDTTVEARALDAGATDFLTKPIEPEIARRRLRYAINQRDLEDLHIKNRVLEELQYQADHDELTGICSRTAFYRLTQDMIDSNPQTTHLLMRWDIEKFKLVNDLFGMATGDRVLCAAANSLAAHLRGKGTYGRFGADNFIMCFEEGAFDPVALMNEITKDVSIAFADDGMSQAVVIAAGVFRVDDPSLGVDLMCDRAGMALQTVKGDFDQHVAYYDDRLRHRLIEEQEIADRAETALANEEFQVYLQPVYSLQSGLPASAEALVRWQRPGEGLVSPGAFIPLFESNGFIARLDHFMLEQVCKVQAERAAAGHDLIPISVNLSRRSVYNPKVCDEIFAIVEKYKVDPHLIRIEITESAYMDNADQLISTVDSLRAYGFVVLMDDFGSGYSSFNTLKDIPVDILKVDMKFMEGFESGGRVGTILASILRMTKWLGIPAIAEGVETADQVRLLKSIGCEYVQGFYFARPMTLGDFSDLVAEHKTSMPAQSHAKSMQGVDDVLSGGLFDQVMNDILGVYAVIDVNEDGIEIVRANDRFSQLFGIDAFTSEDEDMEALCKIAGSETDEVHKLCADTLASGSGCNALLHLAISTGEVVPFHVTFSLVARTGESTGLLVAALRAMEPCGLDVPTCMCPLALAHPELSL